MRGRQREGFSFILFFLAIFLGGKFGEEVGGEVGRIVGSILIPALYLERFGVVSGLLRDTERLLSWLSARLPEPRTVCWLNVDKPTKRNVIHRVGCKWEAHKAPTAHKGIGEVRRDGGWLPFASEKQAREYSTGIYPAHATKQCADCIRKQD